MTRHPLLLVLSALNLLLLFGLSLTLAAWPSARAAQADSTIALVGIDADPEGNTATALGDVDFCARTELGSEVDVDLVVDSIPEDRPMIAFEMHVLYDPQIVEVVAVDYDQLLGAKDSFQPMDISDVLPDSDGDYKIAVIDVASNVNTNTSMESGPGVLSRITLRTKATGIADLTIAADPPTTYPAVFDDQNTIPLVDHISAAAIAVGQDCPSTPAQPPVTPVLPVTPVPTPRPVEETPVSTQAPMTPGPASTSPASDTPVPGDTSDTGEGVDNGEDLAEDVDATQTTIDVIDSTPFSVGDLIRVGDETMRITGITGNTLTVTRGVLGTTATAHDRGALVAAETDQNGDSDGVPTALIVVLAALGITAAASGGWVLYRRRKGRA